MDNEVSTEVHAIHPTGLPLACSSRMEREPLGFPPSSRPRRCQRRPSGWGQAIEHSPRTTLSTSTSVDPPIFEFTCSVRPHVARVVPVAVEVVAGDGQGREATKYSRVQVVQIEMPKPLEPGCGIRVNLGLVGDIRLDADRFCWQRRCYFACTKSSRRISVGWFRACRVG